MENFKFIISSIIIIFLLAYGGYWAFSTLESGAMHIDNQRQKELETKNEELEKQVSDLKREIALLEADKEELKIISEQEDQTIEEEIPEEPKPNTNPTVYKDQTLINELQKLVDGNVYLKNKSQGPSVGSVQRFLNIYNKTTNRVDNDYGAKTVADVKAFQKDQGLTVDGEAGANTFRKMITWLKSR
jgi:murein L,D-transpeptidase YcbB/YkuD